MKRLFGTDGIRGIVNKDLTGNLAYKVGLATAKMLKTNHFRLLENSPFNNNFPVVLIGTDTRNSKDMLLSGISCGLCAGGVNVIHLGILPTPAVAFLTKSYPFASIGIMITASHNPKEYNGIKIIGPDGYKLPDELEEQIEESISSLSKDSESSFLSENFGKIITNYHQTARKDYLNHLLSLFLIEKSFPLKVAIDCSNGSASTCYDVFKDVGISVSQFNTDLSGEHINDNCGSTHLEFLQHLIKTNPGYYNCGVAFDGDADRCLLVDEQGNVVDGDHILTIVGNYFKKIGKLKNNTIVGTIMSNLGLINYCKENQIRFLSTKVGDKYVLEEMLINDCCLGGEQSGHIIFKDFATTGDGILTALMILDIMSKTKTPLSVLKNQMNKYPQVSSKITADFKAKTAFLANTTLRQEIDEKANKALGKEGRVVVRPSGTENYIRIMVEGKDLDVINDLCCQIKKMITSALKCTESQT